ncbi:MAG: hypothetical protein U0797_14895 [Gemmataceae bacterium]
MSHVHPPIPPRKNSTGCEPWPPSGAKSSPDGPSATTALASTWTSAPPSRSPPPPLACWKAISESQVRRLAHEVGRELIERRDREAAEHRRRGRR